VGDDFTTMPIGGQWRPGRSGKTGTDTDPWSGDTITEIPLANAADLDEAVQGAAAARRDWAARPPSDRAGVMLAAAALMAGRKDEITGWLVRESGGTVAKAQLEWGLAHAVLLEAAALTEAGPGPGEPARVTTVASPWTFPLELSARPAAPALAAGGAVVLRPSSDTPVTGGLLLARIFEQAGLPPGVLSVVVGADSEIGDTVAACPAGGNGPLAVLDDADLNAAASAAVFALFFHAGQICLTGARLIVDLAVYDEFVALLTKRVCALRAGDPADPLTDIGPVINAQRLAGLQDIVARATAAGARQVLGGPPSGPSGLLLPPHLLLTENEVAGADGDVAGPLVRVMPAAGEEDALRIANRVPGGRSAAVFTRDLERGRAFAHRASARLTYVNDWAFPV
jgi:aldehyde dehydrogenase (NAD+)